MKSGFSHVHYFGNKMEKYFEYKGRWSSVYILGASDRDLVSKLDKQAPKSEFDSHWVSH